MSSWEEFQEKLRTKGLEGLGLFYGRYPATVVDNDDPEKKGRLKVLCQQVTGTTAVWARPAFAVAGKDSGLLGFPDAGDGVWLSFTLGQPANPVWSGGWLGAGELPEGCGPGVHVWRTKGGQEVRMHEADDKLSLTTAGGLVLVLNGADDTVEVTTAAGGKLTLAGKDLTVIADTAKIGNAELVALDGVVTRKCICSFTGIVHPDASGVVMANKGGV